MSGGSAKRAFDPHTLYDVSEEEMRRIAARRELRENLKNEFAKKHSNPFKPLGETLHDPVVQRFISMKAYHYHMFKATPKFFNFAFVSTFLPIAVLYFSIDYFRERFEKKVRTGQIAYKDRFFKC